MIDERIRQIGDIEDIMLDTYSAGMDTSDSRTIEAQTITDYRGNVIESFPEETFDLHSIKDVKEAMNQSLQYYDEHIQTLNSKDFYLTGLRHLVDRRTSNSGGERQIRPLGSLCCAFMPFSCARTL